MILETGGKEPSQKVLEEAAQLAAYHSKARDSAQVPVDYCAVRYVKKKTCRGKAGHGDLFQPAYAVCKAGTEMPVGGIKDETSLSALRCAAVS